MSTRVNKINRIIMAISIKVQPIPIVGIFIQKPTNYRIVKPRPEIVLACYGVILFSCIAEAVLYGFLFCRKVAKRIVLILVADIPILVRDVRYASQVVGCIMVIGLRGGTVGADEVIAADIAGYRALRRFFQHDFPIVEQEPHEPSVLLKLCAQSLAVITVFLDAACLCVNLCQAVQAVVGVLVYPVRRWYFDSKSSHIVITADVTYTVTNGSFQLSVRIVR